MRGEGALLLDAGLSARFLRDALGRLGLDEGDLRGILVSHEHADHVRGAPGLAADLGIPLYGTPGTLAAITGTGLDRRPVPPGSLFEAAGFRARFFPVEHDAAEPAGLRLDRGASSLGYLTDTGRATPAIARELTGCRDLLVESNHDADLLRDGLYPAALKRRIQGARGHLSNAACGELLGRVVSDRTRRVVLTHLSRANNTPELALATAHAMLHRAGRVPPDLRAAPPRGPLGPFSF